MFWIGLPTPAICTMYQRKLSIQHFTLAKVANILYSIKRFTIFQKGRDSTQQLNHLSTAILMKHCPKTTVRTFSVNLNHHVVILALANELTKQAMSPFCLRPRASDNIILSLRNWKPNTPTPTSFRPKHLLHLLVLENFFGLFRIPTFSRCLRLLLLFYLKTKKLTRLKAVVPPLGSRWIDTLVHARFSLIGDIFSAFPTV